MKPLVLLFALVSAMVSDTVIQSGNSRFSTRLAIEKDANFITQDKILTKNDHDVDRNLIANQERFFHFKAQANIGNLRAGTKLYINARKGIGGKVTVHSGRRQIAHVGANLGFQNKHNKRYNGGHGRSYRPHGGIREEQHQEPEHEEEDEHQTNHRDEVKEEEESEHGYHRNSKEEHGHHLQEEHEDENEDAASELTDYNESEYKE